MFKLLSAIWNWRNTNYGSGSPPVPKLKTSNKINAERIDLTDKELRILQEVMRQVVAGTTDCSYGMIRVPDLSNAFHYTNGDLMYVERKLRDAIYANDKRRWGWSTVRTPF
jgi:hypothetical protein